MTLSVRGRTGSVQALRTKLSTVMAGLVPAIHVSLVEL
jgi:hypothetical protein